MNFWDGYIISVNPHSKAVLSNIGHRGQSDLIVWPAALLYKMWGIFFSPQLFCELTKTFSLIITGLCGQWATRIVWFFVVILSISHNLSLKKLKNRIFSSFPLYWDHSEIKCAVKLLYSDRQGSLTHLGLKWAVCGPRRKIRLTFVLWRKGQRQGMSWPPDSQGIMQPCLTAFFPSFFFFLNLT